MPLQVDYYQNGLLGVWPAADFERVAGSLELVKLPVGAVLYEPDIQSQHAYFPTTAIASLQYVLASGATSEAASVGNEGVLGVSLFLGGNTTPSFAKVMVAGHAYRMERSVLRREFDRSDVSRTLLLRYAQSLFTQIAQTIVCTRLHHIEQQLCRLLLAILDRIPSPDFVITHELLANTLGVRREGITVAARRLQNAGVIRYHRGHVYVLERKALERGACECYAVVKKEVGRLLPPVVRLQ